MPQERIYTSEDYWNLPEGQRAELIDGKFQQQRQNQLQLQKLKQGLIVLVMMLTVQILQAY